MVFAPTTAPAVSGVQNTLSAAGLDILAQIRARPKQAPLTAPGETIAGPVVPEGMPPTPAVKISTDLAELRSKLGQNINPIEQAATEAKVARGIDMSQKRLAANKPDIALRKDIKETAKGFVTKKGDNVNVDERAFNELMPEGRTIDWSQAPDVSGMSLKDARIAIRKFAFSESKKKVAPELPSNIFEVGNAPPGVSQMMTNNIGTPTDIINTLMNRREIGGGVKDFKRLKEIYQTMSTGPKGGVRFEDLGERSFRVKKMNGDTVRVYEENGKYYEQKE
jgi:hypothetical protein